MLYMLNEERVNRILTEAVYTSILLGDRNATSLGDSLGDEDLWGLAALLVNTRIFWKDTKALARSCQNVNELFQES